MSFFDILCEILDFERIRGYRDITQIDMSLGYLTSLDSLKIPYTEYHETEGLKGIPRSILGIPVFVSIDDKTMWVKYTVMEAKG